MSDGGKGDARRKGEDQDAFAKGYELIWGKKTKFYDAKEAEAITKTGQENLKKILDANPGLLDADTDGIEK
jgi:hypothetical protein